MDRLIINKEVWMDGCIGVYVCMYVCMNVEAKSKNKLAHHPPHLSF